MWNLWYSPGGADPGAKLTNELDASRIQRIAKLRRAAIRSRSYCIIALVFCVVAAFQLIYAAIHRYKSGVGGIATFSYLVYAAMLLFAAGYCIRLAGRFHREARLPPAAMPDRPPDFSKLSDGSQRARNLDQIIVEVEDDEPT
jgi:hypothetical protein